MAFKKCSSFQFSDKDFFDAICEGEWTWSGVRGGIMDQFTSLNAKAGCAFILDCRTSKIHPTYGQVTLPSDLRILIANTNVKHELVGSPYNERRASCERAVKYVQDYLNSPDIEETTPEEKELKRKKKAAGVTHLRDVPLSLLLSTADYHNNKSKLMDARAYRRALHAITEDTRTIKTAEAFKQNDLPTVGKLLNEGHVSLRDDYKVSCDELDVMVDIAQSTEGVYGARMMGGGFGGCAIVLLKPEYQDKVIKRLEIEYKKRTNIDATIIPSAAGNGARLVALGKARK